MTSQEAFLSMPFGSYLYGESRAAFPQRLHQKSEILFAIDWINGNER